MIMAKQLILFTLSVRFFMCEGQEQHDITHKETGASTHHLKHDQVDYCKIRNPCWNDGQCSVSMYGLIECSCAEGFMGDACQISCNKIIESCPDGFEMLPPGSGKCYHISPYTMEKTFIQAQSYCRDLVLSSSLWEPKSQEELDSIRSNMNAGGSYWTGIFDAFDEGSLINVGSGKSFSSSLITDANSEALDCVYFTTGWGLKYGQCESSRQVVCELLNPCDLPDDTVLPVPLVPTEWK